MKWLWFLLWAGTCCGQDLLDRLRLPFENDEANKLFEEGKLEEAIKIYQDLYGQKTKNGAFAYNLGNAYAARGDADKAADLYRKAMTSDHDEARLRSHFNLGNLQMAGQKPGEAIENYINYLGERPDDLDAKRNLELALRQLQQQQQEEQQDQEQKDQQDQQDQQPQNQDQQNAQPQNQDQGDQQQQQDPEDQQQNQDQQEQPQPEPDQQPPENQDQDQDPKDPQQANNQQPQSGKEPLNEKMKEQILEALKAKELEQQKEHQKRKIGKVRRRAKDW